MNARAFLISLFLTISVASSAYSWGFTGHQIITDRAVRLLPTILQDFYWANREILSDLCLAPDLRRDANKSEGGKHYIDLEHYPADAPKLREEAVARFGMDKLSDSGWVPWNTQDVYADLVEAMEDRDYPAILRLSGDLSHYVADAHVPLHTTDNYNGQLTADTGVHARFESELVDQFPEIFPFDPRPAVMITDVPSKLWSIVRSSQTSVASVLKSDRENRMSVPSEGYSIARARANHGPVAARRMNDASHEVASFWYTAWVEAGRPDLAGVDFSSLVRRPRPLSHTLLYYEGDYKEDIAEDWPADARDALRRIRSYLKSKTSVRISKVNWVKRRDKILVGITAVESESDLDDKKIEKDLRRRIRSAKIKFRSRD